MVSIEHQERARELESKARSSINTFEFEKAVNYANEGLSINRNYTFLFIRRGQALLKLNNINKAISSFNDAIKFEEHDNNIVIHLQN